MLMQTLHKHLHVAMFRPAALLSFEGYIYRVHAPEYATVCFCVAATQVLTRFQSTETIAIRTDMDTREHRRDVSTLNV